MAKIVNKTTKSNSGKTSKGRNIFYGTLLVLIAMAIAGHSYYFKVRECPNNYINIPDNKYKICIAKYEMKKGPNGKAISSPHGLPWTDLTKKEAILACLKNGRRYSLIEIETWTSIARVIADMPDNWSTGIEYKGFLNVGHSTPNPRSGLEASPNDEVACYKTSQNCSLSEWNFLRRVHLFPNGEVIWDFSGNVAEFVLERLPKTDIKSNFFSQISMAQFPINILGAYKLCDDPNSLVNHHCGYGYFDNFRKIDNAAIVRGGDYNSAGVFNTAYRYSDTPKGKSQRVGFRCAYDPVPTVNSFEGLKELLP